MHGNFDGFPANNRIGVTLLSPCAVYLTCISEVAAHRSLSKHLSRHEKQPKSALGLAYQSGAMSNHPPPKGEILPVNDNL